MLRRKHFILFLLLILIAGAAYYFLYIQKAGKSDVSPETPSDTTEQSFIEVTEGEDCSNECQNYQGEQEKHQYCRAVCGFTVENGLPSNPTSTDETRSKDYQTKETAIKEKNIKKCEEIEDSQLEDSCQARVTEEIFSTQNGNGFETAE